MPKRKEKKKSVCCCYCSRSSPPLSPSHVAQIKAHPDRNPKTDPRPRKRKDALITGSGIHPSLHPSRFPVVGCDVCLFFPPGRRARKYKEIGKGQDEKRKRKKIQKIHRLEKSKSPAFSQCCPQFFSLPEIKIPLDPSEKENPPFFCVVRKVFSLALALVREEKEGRVWNPSSSVRQGGGFRLKQQEEKKQSGDGESEKFIWGSDPANRLLFVAPCSILLGGKKMRCEKGAEK